MNRLITVLLLMASAQAYAGGLSYSYVEAGYAKASFDDTDVDADGFGVEGSFLLAPSVFAVAGYTQAESDEFTVGATTGSIEVNGGSIGLGFRNAISADADFVATANFLFADVTGDGGFAGVLDDDDTGYLIDIGVRGLVAPQFELAGGVSYGYIFDDGETSFGIDALFHVTPQFSLIIGGETSSDARVLSAGARLNF